MTPLEQAQRGYDPSLTTPPTPWRDLPAERRELIVAAAAEGVRADHAVVVFGQFADGAFPVRFAGSYKRRYTREYGAVVLVHEGHARVLPGALKSEPDAQAIQCRDGSVVYVFTGGGPQ